MNTAGMFFKREVFILFILTSTVFWVRLRKAVDFGISELKLDNLILYVNVQIENQIEKYVLIYFDRNTHGGGIACFKTNILRYKPKSFLVFEIKNVFMKVFLLYSNLLIVGTFYCTPNQTSFN